MYDLIGFISLYYYEISYIIKRLCGFHDQAKTASLVFTLFHDSYGPSPPNQSKCMKCPPFQSRKSCHLSLSTYLSNIHVCLLYRSVRRVSIFVSWLDI
ncbi:hypothetical protein N665_0552s0002 [Sinapis alba]|nr:hypothetical protein N665_0552s0002 [Sinapis alba]